MTVDKLEDRKVRDIEIIAAIRELEKMIPRLDQTQKEVMVKRLGEISEKMKNA